MEPTLKRSKTKRVKRSNKAGIVVVHSMKPPRLIYQQIKSCIISSLEKISNEDSVCGYYWSEIPDKMDESVLDRYTTLVCANVQSLFNMMLDISVGISRFRSENNPSLKDVVWRSSDIDNAFEHIYNLSSHRFD